MNVEWWQLFDKISGLIEVHPHIIIPGLVLPWDMPHCKMQIKHGRSCLGSQVDTNLKTDDQSFVFRLIIEARKSNFTMYSVLSSSGGMITSPVPLSDSMVEPSTCSSDDPISSLSMGRELHLLIKSANVRALIALRGS